MKGIIDIRFALASISILMTFFSLKCDAALYTFVNGNYLFRQSVDGTLKDYTGLISGSFVYTGNPASSELLSNVNITVGAPSPNPNSVDGTYWSGPGDYRQTGLGGGTPTTNTIGMTFNYGSAQQAKLETNGTTTQVLYFWNSTGNGLSLKINRPLTMTPGDIYNESGTSYAAGRYFCNAVLDGSSALLTGSGKAGSCASNVSGTINQRLIYSYNLSLTAPSPAIGLGLLPLLQTILFRRRMKRSKVLAVEKG